MSKKTNKTIEAGVLHRGFSFDREAISEEGRTVEIAFSSEEPVERWFGNEILDHSKSSVDLGRLKNGGAILVDHDPADHIGVVEAVSIDGDKRGRATVRFGKSSRAEEIWQDVVDGIRHNVSVGYRINKMILDSEEEGAETYRATSWTPHEISFVSVPADSSVGVGRKETNDKRSITIENLYEEKKMSKEKVEVTSIDVDAERAVIRKAELSRIGEIEALGNKFEAKDMARDFVNQGKDADDFRSALLEKMGNATAITESADIGMTDTEVRQFSFMKAINALANPGDRRAQENASFEFETSRAAAEKYGKNPQGLMIPMDVLKGQRDLNVGTATAGGHTVATDLLADSFIDKLDNAMVATRAGATVLRDLQGNIAIPRATGGATSYWVAESGAITESAAAFDQVTMSPKTVGAFSDVSRKLLLQSSVDVESFVRNDLALRLALAIDNKAFEGDGTSNTPTGVVNATGVGSVAFASATAGAATWGEIIDMESEVSQDNALLGNLSYITNAAQMGYLKQTKKDSGSGIFLVEGSQLNGYNVLVSNQISTAGQMLFGNWADLMIGYWSGVDINVDTSTGSTSGTVRIVALQDVDVAVRHGESFAKGV
jgi:HK97 family phage major capsid protein/HK97 family phage prohead protease